MFLLVAFQHCLKFVAYFYLSEVRPFLCVVYGYDSSFKIDIYPFESCSFSASSSSSFRVCKKGCSVGPAQDISILSSDSVGVKGSFELVLYSGISGSFMLRNLAKFVYVYIRVFCVCCIVFFPFF